MMICIARASVQSAATGSGLKYQGDQRFICLGPTVDDRAGSRVGQLKENKISTLVRSESEYFETGRGDPGVDKGDKDRTREKENKNSENRGFESRCRCGSRFLGHSGINALDDLVRKGCLVVLLCVRLSAGSIRFGQKRIGFDERGGDRFHLRPTWQPPGDLIRSMVAEPFERISNTV